MKVLICLLMLLSTPTLANHRTTWLKYAFNIGDCAPISVKIKDQKIQIHGWRKRQCVISLKPNFMPALPSSSTQYCYFSKEDIKIVQKFAKLMILHTTKKSVEKKYHRLMKYKCHIGNKAPLR